MALKPQFILLFMQIRLINQRGSKTEREDAGGVNGCNDKVGLNGRLRHSSGRILLDTRRRLISMKAKHGLRIRLRNEPDELK